MSFQPVLLWSDTLLWLLTFSVVALFAYSARAAHVRRAWARLGKNAVATGAATLLAAFLLVGLLDSLHYRLRLPDAPGQTQAIYAVETLSVLDGLLSNLREQHERSYSAPLAIRSFVMETEETAAGATRIYPRLTYGGAHLENEDQWFADVALRALRGAGLALICWGMLAGLVFWRRNRQSAFAWRGVLGALLVLMLAGFTLFELASVYHVFGADKVGQDVFYQTLKSIRTALVIGLVTTLVLMPLAVLLGIVAGYFRGWADDVIQYLYTVLNSIPSVLLIAAAVLMTQVVIDTHPQWFATAAERADLRLVALCFILGATSWTGLARLLRGETLKLRELDYIQAARAFGVSSGRIILRHILPNLTHLVIISLVMDFSALVLAEAVLSYIGIGVDPSMHSFGAMINNARMELSREPAVWWSLAAAFSFMLTLVLAANLLADAVRDAFDPRHDG
jgi:peptide/nickel transport system permease protein